MIQLHFRKRALFYVWLALIAPAILYASQPPGGWRKDVEVKGEPLTLKWPSPHFRPECVIWMQDYAVAKPYYVTEERDARIERAGVNGIPVKLLVIPKDHSLLPQVLDVPAEAQEINFSTRPIPKNEMWFWGLTPENPFPSPRGSAATFVSVRMLRRKDIYAEFYGCFLWRIKRDDRQDPAEPFYFSSDDIEAVSSEGFDKAGDVSDALCRTYTGGDCQFLFATKPDGWGKAYQINFKAKLKNGPVLY